MACHRGTKAPAGLDLTQLPLRLEDAHNHSLWVRVHDAVEKREMPPAAVDRVAPAERTAFVRQVAAPLLEHDRARQAAQGRSVLRRLNRYEYENTMRDLLSAPWLQLKDSLPEDGIVRRLNKSGQALDVSHVQMARYLETAEQALRDVVAARAEPMKKKRYYARESNGMTRHMFYGPFNNSPERTTTPIVGWDVEHDVMAKKAPLTVGDRDPARRELEALAVNQSSYIGIEYHYDQFVAPVGGRYRIRFSAYSVWFETKYGIQGRKWWRPSREKITRGRTTEPVTVYGLMRGGSKRLLGSFDTNPEPGVYELEVTLQRGEKIQPDAARLFRSRPGWIGSPEASEEGMPGIAHRWIEVEGPFEIPSAKASVNVAPKTLSAAQQAVRDFMRRAYRRPPTTLELARYTKIATERWGKATPEEAMISAYSAVLCSPGFLYLEEKPGPLDHHALAARLSYFLTNSTPDPALREAAARGLLRKPVVLRAHTDRLLDSPRTADFVYAFLDYWLDLRKAGDTTPDQTLYPDYYLDDLLVESAENETRLYFEELIKKNLGAGLLVRSDFTFLNSHLARHYGIPGVEGVAMRRVTLPAGSVRGGLLTQASVLKVTANGTTTSPVLRGAWIMERIIGEAPPPPPPGVPAVEPDTRGATTIRQQLDKHRSVASCAACHAKIDPPGFALENFDIFGAWRTQYRSLEEGRPVEGIGRNGHPFAFRLGPQVDASGQWRSRAGFESIADFKQILWNERRTLARNLVGQFVTYSTGAPVGFADRAEVERILDRSAGRDYRVRDLMHEIIQSKLFLQK